MHTIEVNEFGPINNCFFKIKEFTTLIGPQTSGKSTISKLVYFFLNVREEMIDFILSSLDEGKDRLEIANFNKQVRRRFIEFWGPAPQENQMFIRYEYNPDTWAEIRLDSTQQKFIQPRFSKNIIDSLKEQYMVFRPIYTTGGQSSMLFDSDTSMTKLNIRREISLTLKKQFNDLLDFDKEILFIPAGRSLLSILSDQLLFIRSNLLDYPMKQFIERINTTQSFFSKSIEEIIIEKKYLSNSAIDLSLIDEAKSILKKILKGDYIFDKEGGKLYVNPATYTKMTFASSGQQESVWILLSLFLIALERSNAFVFVEEPEAHLFPDAQKDIVELMCLLACSANTSFFLTTHSPYILSSLNNHIYAFLVGKDKPKEVSKVIDNRKWLDPNRVNGFLVTNGQLENLIDVDLHLFKAELIDGASARINEEFDHLLTIENGGDNELFGK